MALFEENEMILYMSTDKGVKQQIEDGLNRNLKTITTITSFIEELNVAINQHGRINIIFLDSLNKEIKMYLDKISEVLTTFKKENLTVIEIGLPHHVFEEVGSLRFGTVVDFIEYAQYQRRISEVNYLNKSTNEEDKKHSIQYRKLIIENESRKEKILKLNEEIENCNKKIHDLNSKVLLLENKINSVYSVETENAIKHAELLKDELQEMKRQRDVELTKNKEFEKELNLYRSQNVDFKTQINSYKKLMAENRDEKQVLKKDIKRLKEAVKKEQLEKAKIYASRVDSEDLYVLNNNLIEERNKSGRLSEENDELRINIRTLELKISEYVQENETLRAGGEDIEKFGRTNKLDSCEFNYTNVYYFKIINALPYFNSAVNCLKNILENQNQTVHIMILKNDEGIDGRKFSEYPLYPYISDVRSEDLIYRIYPSHKMFKNAEQYEEKCDVLIVMDYIQSNEYYISTKAQYKICTVVRRIEDMEQYGFKGKPITLGSGSVLNIDFDKKIQDSQMQEVKNKLIRDKVEQWMKFGLIDDNIGNFN